MKTNNKTGKSQTGHSRHKRKDKLTEIQRTLVKARSMNKKE